MVKTTEYLIDNETALIKMTEEGYGKIIEMLLKRGAKVDIMSDRCPFGQHSEVNRMLQS